MKAIILAGGNGSRLYPATHTICKQLLPVYDKPMIYYPLTTLMLAGLREILIITNPYEKDLFQHLLKDGSQWGISIEYAVQPKPEGLAQAFIIGENFIKSDSVCLMLGDNILYGSGLANMMQKIVTTNQGATIFSYYVADPRRYGVVYFDKEGNPIDIVEKPENPQSQYVAIGLYFYNNRVIDIAKEIKPSARGELEITDINRRYLEEGELDVRKFSRGVAWLDTGTPESLLEAANFIRILEHRQLLKLGCPEEVAWRMGYIDNECFFAVARSLKKNSYGKYLLNILEQEADTLVTPF